MKNFLFKLRIIADLIISVILVYVALTYAFTSMLPNFIMFIVAIYVFGQALGYIDKLNGYNKNNTGLPDDN